MEQLPQVQTQVVNNCDRFIDYLLQTFASNIKSLFANKADDDIVLTAPSASTTQNVAGTFKIKAILKILIDNVKALFDNKAENNQTMTAPTADNTQQGAGSFTIVSILQTLMNNIKHLFDNKADNSQTIGDITAVKETQVGTGALTVLSILQTFAKKHKSVISLEDKCKFTKDLCFGRFNRAKWFYYSSYSRSY